VDCNPYSTFFERANLGGLLFAEQIKIFRTGFGMWESQLEDGLKEHQA
jgi:hypothetical protein